MATVAHLQATSIDDCLELFDLIMTSELLGKAERETNRQRAREHPRLARASAKLARVVDKLLEASSSEEMVRVSDLWHEIETVASREELHSAIATVDELVPHLDEDDEGDVRARLSERIRMVSGFLRELCEVIELGRRAYAMENHPAKLCRREPPSRCARLASVPRRSAARRASSQPNGETVHHMAEPRPVRNLRSMCAETALAL